MPNTRISEWFHQYSNDLYQFLIYYLGSSDVEDLVQEVFIRAFKNMDSFEEKYSPKTWLFRIARHIAIDEIRRKQRSKIKNLIFMRNQESQVSDTPESFLNLNETNKDLYNAIQQLKENYRDVIILRGIKELSVEETVDIRDKKTNELLYRYGESLGNSIEKMVFREVASEKSNTIIRLQVFLEMDKINGTITKINKSNVTYSPEPLFKDGEMIHSWSKSDKFPAEKVGVLANLSIRTDEEVEDSESWESEVIYEGFEIGVIKK